MKILRKDGIEYERTKTKNLNYDKKICIKLSTTQYEEAKKMGEDIGISFAELVREGLKLVAEKKKVELNEDS